MTEDEEVEKSREKYKEFIGMQVKGGRYKVMQKKITAYCQAVGHMDPKYVDENIEGGTVAPPEFGAVYAMSGLTSLATVRGLIKNFNKLLHTGQKYEYYEPIKPGDVLTSESQILDVYEKNKMLWITLRCTFNNQDGKKATVAEFTAGIREGGF
ncbi:MAG: MaoC family dehydratase N-terminal domain-containing protein [Halobacteriota archaeon]|nr:MaoC family dehydratase N-terminal domain-containing protein [Halobacteriota archaeon]